MDTTGIFEKIDQLLSIEPGWYFGQGDPADPEAVRRAKEIAGYAVGLGLRVDALPCLEGQVLLGVFPSQPTPPILLLEICVDKADSGNYVLWLQVVGSSTSVVKDWAPISVEGIKRLIRAFVYCNRRVHGNEGD